MKIVSVIKIGLFFFALLGSLHAKMIWREADIRNYRFTLVSEHEHLVFVFNQKNQNALVTFGLKNQYLICPVYTWDINDNGDLVFYNVVDDNKSEVMRFELCSLDEELVSTTKECEDYLFRRKRVSLPITKK